MFLNKITLENFRIFENRQTFELRPITILVGKNNSGKSTLLNAIKLLIGQAKNYDTEGFIRFLDLSKTSTGIYEGKDIKPISSVKSTFDIQFDFKGLCEDSQLTCINYFYFYTLFDNSKVQFTYKLEDNQNLDISKIELRSGADKTIFVFEERLEKGKGIRLGDIKPNFTIKKHFYSTVNGCLRKNKSLFDRLFVHFSNLDLMAVELSNIEYIFRGTYSDIKKWKKNILPTIEKSLGEKVTIENARLFFSVILMIRLHYSETSNFNEGVESLLRDLDKPDSEKGYRIVAAFINHGLGAKQPSIMVDALNAYMNNIHVYFRDHFKDIGATRIGSKRYFTKEDTNTNLLAKQLFDEYFDIDVASYILKDILGVADSIKVKLIEGFMKKIEICKSERTYNLSDMGYGISQLMPLILNPDSDRSEPDSFPHTWLLSEPEANLHPSLQSKIADLVAYQYNKYGSTFIIETHSEYLIRKLQYLCKDVRSPLSPEDVMIHYFYHPDDKPFDEPQVKQITINEEGNLTGEFGRGFYDESSRIALDLWNMNASQKN